MELIGSPSPSLIGVPLKIPNRTIGVLVLQHYEEENIYSDRDVKFLNSVASQIALAIERKRAEDQLRESEDMFRRLFDKSADAILILGENHFISCNPSTVSMLKYSSEEDLLNKFPWEISPEKQPDGLLSSVKAQMMIDKALAEGYNRFEWIHLKSDRSELPVEVMLTPIHLKGKQCLYAIMRDITDRKQAEDEITKRNEELSMLNAEKDKFFSIIAHDLRSPFNGFIALTEMINKNISGFSSDELVTLTYNMNLAAKNLFNLLQNLLEWSQFQKGSISYTPIVLSLSVIVSRCIEQINLTVIQKGITIINEVSENQKIIADEIMINSILSNLLSNAVKFTRRDGTVIISTKKTKDQMIEISIKDTGIGMSKKMMEKLFMLGENTSRKGTEGELSTGLGLMLCKEFIEKNAGKIWVESEEGKGSNFYFTLPSS